jgi:heme a synthase
MFLFPLERMTGGIFYEHAHRLFGALVGLTTMTLLALAHLERRPWVRPLAWAAFVLVVVQGVMGGVRVRDTSVGLAVAHGITGQVFLALLLIIAALTSRTWTSAPPARPRPSGETDLSLGAWLVGAVAVQLALGALVRHLHIEPTWHICMAVVVVTLGGFAGVRAWGLYGGDEPTLRRLGLGLAHALGLQLLLGIAALALTMLERPAGQYVVGEVPITVAHQTLGATILGLAVLLRLWLGRLVAPGS